MIRELIIHGGYHKTGTSTIQNFLLANQMLLKETQNLELLKTRGLFQFSPGKSKVRLNPHGIIGWKKLEGDRVLLSRENFAWVNSIKELKLLRALLYQYTEIIRVLFYLRRQDHLVVSHKQQGYVSPIARCMHGQSWEALPSYESLTKEVQQYRNFASRLAMWEKVFGRESLTVKIFEKERYSGDLLIREFCNTLNISMTGVTIPDKMNESLSLMGQAMLHHAPPLIKVLPITWRDLVKAIRKWDQSQASGDMFLPSQGEAKCFYTHFRKKNKKLSRYGLGEKVFSEDFSSYPEVGSRIILKEEEIKNKLFEILSHILE